MALADILKAKRKAFSPEAFSGANNTWSTSAPNTSGDVENTPEPDMTTSAHPDISPSGTFSSAISSRGPSITGTKEFQDYLDTGEKLRAVLTPNPVSMPRALLGAFVGNRNPMLGSVITGDFQRQRAIAPLMQQYNILGGQINQARQLEMEQANLDKMAAETDLAKKHSAFFEAAANVKENPVDKMIHTGPDPKDPNSVVGVFQRPDNTTYTKPLGIGTAVPKEKPTDEDKAISDYIKGNNLDDTPANRDKARSVLKTRDRPPKDPEMTEINKNLKKAQLDKMMEPTADEKRRDDLAENLNENLDQLEEISKRRPDLFGPVNGRVTQLKIAAGSNDKDIGALGTIRHQIGMVQQSTHGMRSAFGVDSAAESVLNNFHNGGTGLSGAIDAARKSAKTFQNDAQKRRKVLQAQFGEGGGEATSPGGFTPF